jgi:hypothetical protein
MMHPTGDAAQPWRQAGVAPGVLPQVQRLSKLPVSPH